MSTHIDTINVLVADDHTVVRAGLRALIGTARDMQVVSEASNGREAVALALRFRPHVVVMAISISQLDGIAATREILQSGVDTRVLVLTLHAEEEYVLAAMEAGATGFLVKSAVERELLDAIRSVAHGDTYVQPSSSRALVRGLLGASPDDEGRRRLAQLSDRERSVLRMIAEGHSGPAVAHALGISAKTVETYKQRIHEKIGIGRRHEMVRFALEVGLLDAGGDTELHPAAVRDAG